MSIKNRVSRTIQKTKKKMSIKIPTPYPILFGELLKNRTAIITGGGSGIGYSIAEAFVKNGANIIICGRNEKKLAIAKEKLKKLSKDDQTIDVIQLDIGKTKLIKTTLDEFLSKYDKKIDILVNNAGIVVFDGIENVSIEDYEQLMKINLEGTYFMSQYFLDYMKKEKIKGNILNIASSSSLRPAHTPYNVSKWGIKGLTMGTARIAIKYGITVNGIAPGPTATEMLNMANNDNINNDRVPAGRYVMPEEIANLATILVSDISKMVVGDILYVTGGSGTITYDDVTY